MSGIFYFILFYFFCILLGMGNSNTLFYASDKSWEMENNYIIIIDFYFRFN